MLPQSKLIKLAFLSAFAGLSVSCQKRAYNSEPKIVSGALVEENDPVYLSTVSLDQAGKPVCSGFVLDKRTIVTAAHCITGWVKGSIHAVTFGSLNRKLHQTVEVPGVQAMAHPNWKKEELASGSIEPLPQSPKYDIGVIVLGEDAPEWVKPIPVKTAGEVAAGAVVVLAGYGQTRPQPSDSPMPEFSGFLRKTQVQIAQINDAAKEFVWQSPKENPRTSSCHGDSGGPMFFQEKDGSLTMIGVTSRSYSTDLDCKEKGIYTDVRAYLDWIQLTREKLASGVVNAGVWLHRYFTATDGSKIALDYKLQRVGTDHTATEIWLNITNPNFSGNEKVSAKLSSYINSLVQEEVKLGFAGEKRFTAKFSKFTNEKVCAIASRWGIKQDISIQINGKGMVDQGSGSEAFVFKFCE